MDPKLVTAARALLDWTQSDLAEHAGLSISAIKTAEFGRESVRPATIKAIFSALERNGIEFPTTGGIRRAEEVASLTRYRGDDFILQHNNATIDKVSRPNATILTCSVNDANWYASPNDNKRFNAWRVKFKPREKVLVPEGTSIVKMPSKTFRVVPLSTLGPVTYSVYEDCVSFLYWEKKETLLLRNAMIADIFRQQFENLWRLGKPG